MRTGKVLSLIVGGLFALLAVLLLAVWLLVNPNHYKAKIVAAVKESTGRDLALEGDIKLSLLPWIALELGPATLGNPPGFDAQPFVSFQHAAVRAKLWPLLRERLEIARVELDGLDVRLQKNAAGMGNWEGFGGANARAPAKDPAEAGGSPLGSLAGFRVTHARVSYQNFLLENLKVESVAAGGVVPISIHFDATRGVAGERASVEAQVDVSNPAVKRYKFAAVRLMGLIAHAGDSRPTRLNVSAPAVDLDLAAQTLAAPAFALDVAGAQVTGDVQGSHLLTEPRVAGSVTLAPLLIREFLQRWGVANPQTRDPRAFSDVAGSTAFSYEGQVLKLDGLKVTLDDTHVEGVVAIENLKTQALKFELSVDKLDVDRYLAPEGQAVVAVQRPEVSDGEARPLQADGTLAIGSLRVSRLDMTEVKATLAAHAGVARVFPLLAQIDGGRYSGDVTLDRRGEPAILSLDEHLTGVDMTQLLASNGKSIHLSGKGNVSVKASGRGLTAESLLETLNGHLDAFITDGAVEGIDLGYELGRAEALINHGPAPAAQDSHRTAFNAFKTSAEIANGVARTKDLTISSAVLRVTGQGSANLPSKAIDFKLLVDTLRTTRGVPLQIPVTVSGTLSDPTLRPDIEALAKGQLKEKLKDVLNDKLRGLFGKP